MLIFVFVIKVGQEIFAMFQSVLLLTVIMDIVLDQTNVNAYPNIVAALINPNVIY